MNSSLVKLAQQLLYVGVFASGLRRHTSRPEYRRTVYAWATSTGAALAARARSAAGAGDSDDERRARSALDDLHATIAAMTAKDGDWYPAETRSLIQQSRALLWIAVGRSGLRRLGVVVDCVAEVCRRMTLTLAGLIVAVGLVFGSPTVRGVVFQSRAALWSLVVLALMLWLGGWLTFPLGLATFWSPLSRRPERAGEAWPSNLSQWRIVGGWSLIGLGFVVTLAAFLLLAPDDTSFRTPFVTTTLLVGMVTFVHGFDIWDYVDPRPIRFIAALVGAAALWFGLGYSPDAPWLTPMDHGATARTTADARWVGADRWPRAGEGPVVVVAASGGGSRAAMFAASAFVAMDEETPAVASAIQSVSGVSGGSLAVSGYVALRLGTVDAPRYLDAMEADYVWPILRSMFIGPDRADAVQREWNRRLSLDGVTLAGLARGWNAGDTRAPIAVLNSADVLGHPVLLSSFAPGLLDAADRTRCAETTGRTDPWICDRDAAHTLQEVAPGLDVPLLSAARASANFPLAFPLVPVRAARSLVGHEHLADPRATRITDGGVFLNSGVQGLYPLLVNQREALRRRGVLLIVLDASAAEEFSAYPGEWETLSALRGAGVGRGQMLHRLMVTRLAADYGARFGCVLVDMRPADLARIPTSWYLDADARASMRRHFDSRRWAAQRAQIEAAFAAVGRGGDGPADVGSCLARPPLY
jgi:hypothetical protein